jgi:predicted metallo-beta-lactamase superfamily hydrolase
MKLIETIERCEKLVLEEIDGCEHYLVWYENSISDTEESRKEIEKINERRNELLEMMQNLRFIKYETNLQELDEMLEKENDKL